MGSFRKTTPNASETFERWELSEEAGRWHRIGSGVSAPLDPSWPNRSDFVHALEGPTELVFTGKHPQRRRVITTLIHGNESSGLEAVRRLLRCAEAPETTMHVFVVSVDAAQRAPALTHRGHPIDLNRCFGPHPTAPLADAIKQRVQMIQPECIVDLHNTSAPGPAYGICDRAGATERLLISQFAQLVLPSTIPLGAFRQWACGIAPTVTIECGGENDRTADHIAYAGLHRMWRSLELEPHGKTVVAESAVRVELDQTQVSSSFAHSDSRADFKFRADLTDFNQQPLPQGATLGTFRSVRCPNWPIRATNASGQTLNDDFFERDGVALKTKRPLQLFMATDDLRVAESDCLFYASPLLNAAE